MKDVFATHWRICIQGYRSCLCKEWRRCGIHLLPLFTCLQCWFRNYLAGGMMWSPQLRFPMRDSSLSVFNFVKSKDALIFCTQAVSFSRVRNTCIDWVWMSHPIQVLFLASWPSMQVCGVIGGHLVSGVRRNSEVWIWCGGSIKLCSWSAPPIVGHQC